jgi:ATP-dependent DNA helicase DinG
LDLADDENPPERDFLLTDIIIPRLPFGTEHSTIHERRKEQWGFIYEVYRAAFQFRQGLGRLIRREGVTNRRLWLLDARMWRDDAPWYMAYFQNLL